MPDDALLRGLNDRQREAVTAPVTPLAILAGAGSGKTRVLTRRIAWQGARGHLDPGHTVAVTFTRKAAGELSDRLQALGVRRSVSAGTFHALALAQLRRRWTERGESVPRLLERKVRLLAPMLARGPGGAPREIQGPGGAPREDQGPGGAPREDSPSVGTEAADVAAEIEWAKARLVGPSGYEAAVVAAGRPTPRPAAEVASYFERYELEKARRGLLDFDDLLWRLADAIEADTTFAAAQRWRYRHFFVDEFQDMNPAQFRLLRAWLGNRGDVCVVGDDDQAVYGFTGADAGYLVDFAWYFSGATIVRLEENYRSSPQILATANAVLPGGRRTKKFLRATLPDGPVPLVNAYPSDAEEARAVARSLRDAHQPGTPWSHMAVLYRTNAQSAHFEVSLRDAGIPCRVRGAARFLDRPEVVAALRELRRAAEVAPGLSLSAHLYDLLDRAGPRPAVGGVPDAERQEHVDTLVRLGQEYVRDDGGPGSLEGFLAHLAASLADDDPVAADAVDLLTFHKAKGLEWPAVFVTGLERGLVPIAYAGTPAALAEERRLLYVAITRAKRDLRLSWAERRTLGGRTMARQASPYLSLIEAALGAFSPTGDGDWQAAVAAERSRLAGARAAAASARGRPGPQGDPKVLAGLVEWRRSLARASGVPAYVIFHDATLAAVAEARPRTRDALLSVPGLGPVKVERYGEALLDVVGRHAS